MSSMPKVYRGVKIILSILKYVIKEITLVSLGKFYLPCCYYKFVKCCSSIIYKYKTHRQCTCMNTNVSSKAYKFYEIIFDIL